MQGIFNIISRRENMTYLCNYPIFPYEGHYCPFEPIDLGFKKKILFIYNICNLSWINIEKCTSFCFVWFFESFNTMCLWFSKNVDYCYEKVMLKLFMCYVIYKDFTICINTFKRGNLLLQLYYFLPTFMIVDFQQLGAWFYVITS